jgi:DNA-binding NtrC family response regulator
MEHMMTAARILLVDDEPALLKAATRVLTLDGLGPTIECTDGRVALLQLSTTAIAAMVIDLSMPAMSGEDLLARVRAEHPDVPVIVMTGSSDLEVAVRCMQGGAVDYLVKPAADDRLTSAVRRALATRQLHDELRSLSQQLLHPPAGHRQRFAEILTQDPRMLDLFRYLEAVAPSPSTVLVTGETGTGKELIAAALHRWSRRPGQLVTINVGGLDETLFSDTLFGHARGAFNNAVEARAGLVQTAADGTLFLDEIGELDLRSQVKLLRLLEDGSYQPLGSDRPRRSAARFVVATNRDLDEEVRAGRFRKDLLFRLRTHHVALPPLRERPGDLPLLVPHFLARAAAELQKPTPTEPPELYARLRCYPFPGNVRELRDLCRDAVARHEGRVLSMRTFVERIDAELARGGMVPTVNATTVAQDASWLPWPLPSMQEIEDEAVREALRRARGNQSAAAEFLRMSHSAFNRRVLALRRESDPRMLPPSAP